MGFLQQNSWTADWLVLIGALLLTIYWLIRDCFKRRLQIGKLKTVIENYYDILRKLNIRPMENMNEFDRLKAENRSKFGTCENFLRQLEFLLDHDCNKLKSYEQVQIRSILNNFNNSMDFHRKTAIKMNAGYQKLEPSTLEKTLVRTIDMRIATIEKETDGLFPAEGIYDMYFKQFSELKFLNIHFEEIKKE